MNSLQVSIWFIFAMFANHVWAQKPANRQLMGIVTEQSKGNKPIADVRLRSAWASPVYSVHDGRFTLVFQDVNPGEAVVVEAQKTGWEVVNEEELRTHLPNDPAAKPLRVILCKEGLLAQNRQLYFNISTDYLTKRYEEKLALLKRSGAGWEKRAAELEEQLKAQRQQARELADKYARTNFDDITKEQQEAFLLFQQGKIPDAIKVLERVNSEAIIGKAKQEKEKFTSLRDTAALAIERADSVIHKQARKLLQQAEYYVLDFQFDRAEQAYEQAALADTTNFSTVFSLAYFLYEQRQYPKALRWYMTAQKIATNDEPDLAMTLNNLGVVFQSLHDYGSARSFYERALGIRERLAQSNPASYEPDLAMTLNNLGVVFQSLHDYGSARSFYERALGIRERLAQSNPASYEPDLAMTLNNLGVVFQSLHDYGSARSFYERALGIRERLAQSNPASYEPDLAMTLNNLGVVFQSLHDYGSARSFYERALGIRERLAQSNPASYEPDLASTLNNLGVVFQSLHDYGSARSFYERALGIRERLAQSNPASYEPDLAMTLNNLGVVFRSLHDYGSARSFYERALGIRERLAQSNPASYEPDLAMTLNNLGVVFQALKEYNSAFMLYGRAVGIRERLAKANPTIYDPVFCKTTWQYCIAGSTMFEDSLSKMYVEEPMKKAKVARLIATNYPGDSLMIDYVKHFQNAEQYFSNAVTRAEIYDLQKAVDATTGYGQKKSLYQTIIAKWEQVVHNTPTQSTYVLRLANAYSGLAWYCLFAKQFAEAETHARQGLTMTNYNRPEKFAEQVEWINTNLALALLYQGKYAEAETIYRALKDKPYNKATYRTTFLTDLDDLEKAGVTHPDVAKIRALLQAASNR